MPATASVATPKTPWEAAWSESLGTTEDLLLAVSRDHVFTAAIESSLVAREADSGEMAWSHDVTGWRALAATATMVVGVAGDHAYGLEASTGQTRWVTETTGPDQRLILADDRVLMVGENDAVLRDVATGSPLGRIGLDGPTVTSALSQGATVLAFEDGRIASFDIPAGLRLWQAQLRQTPVAIASAGDSVYAAMPDGTLQSLDARNGSLRWSFRLRVPIVGVPFAGEKFVHVVLLDNSLRTFNRASGAMLRTDGLGHRPAAGPWVTGSSAVIGLTTGEFIVLDPASGRIETRLAVPGGGVTNVLESAAIGPETFWLASLTIAPGGERRLSAYRHNPPTSVTTEEELVIPPLPDVESTRPPATPAQPDEQEVPAETDDDVESAPEPIVPLPQPEPAAPPDDEAPPPAPVPRPSPFPVP